jgi:hypothetical protein
VLTGGAEAAGRAGPTGNAGRRCRASGRCAAAGAQREVRRRTQREGRGPGRRGTVGGAPLSAAGGAGAGATGCNGGTAGGAGGAGGAGAGAKEVRGLGGGGHWKYQRVGHPAGPRSSQCNYPLFGRALVERGEGPATAEHSPQLG